MGTGGGTALMNSLPEPIAALLLTAVVSDYNVYNCAKMILGTVKSDCMSHLTACLFQLCPGLSNTFGLLQHGL